VNNTKETKIQFFLGLYFGYSIAKINHIATSISTTILKAKAFPVTYGKNKLLDTIKGTYSITARPVYIKNFRFFSVFVIGAI
jgi:hypothetical protein